MHGQILLEKNDVVEICSALPIKHDLRPNFLYNDPCTNWLDWIVERSSGSSNWGDFQRDRIFKPLKMSRTTASMSVHDEDDNIAKPYVVLTDEKQVHIEPTELSSGSMNGGSGGVQSSVNDLLWCKCILRSFENGSENVDGVVHHNSPTFDGIISANPHSAAGGDFAWGGANTARQRS